MNLTYQNSKSSDRLFFWGTFVAGMAACTPGVGQATARGWLHPITLLGCAFGAAALSLGGAVLLKKPVGPINSERRALFGLLGILAIKVLLAFLYPIIP